MPAANLSDYTGQTMKNNGNKANRQAGRAGGVEKAPNSSKTVKKEKMRNRGRPIAQFFRKAAATRGHSFLIDKPATELPAEPVATDIFFVRISKVKGLYRPNR
jgi:hypothetical protein